MFPIVESRPLAPDVRLFRIVAPRIARKREPGQFVIVRLHADGERIPLTIADSDREAGTELHPGDAAQPTPKDGRRNEPRDEKAHAHEEHGAGEIHRRMDNQKRAAPQSGHADESELVRSEAEPR